MTQNFDDLLASCSLRPGPYPAADGTCGWCGEALPKRRRRWCSDECADVMWRMHSWGSARVVALKRDDHRCVRCGNSPDWPEGLAWLHFLEAVCPRPPVPTWMEWCASRGLDPRSAPREEHSLLSAVIRRALRRHHGAREAYQRALNARRLEVNHKVPILGRHAEYGCHHHPDGLETLCHPCHVAETARQFGHRTAAEEPSLFGEAM